MDDATPREGVERRSTGAFGRAWDSSKGGPAPDPDEVGPTTVIDGVAYAGELAVPEGMVSVAADGQPVARGKTSQPGRLSTGAWWAYAGGAFVVVLALILGVAWLAKGGLSGDPAATVSPEPSLTLDAIAPAPYDETPLDGVNVGQFKQGGHPDEPQAYVMREEIWPYVNRGWTLTLFENDPSDPDGHFRALYFISPEGYPFYLYTIRKDIEVGIAGWDADERVAWLVRYLADGTTQPIEFNLATGDVREEWALSALGESVGISAYAAITGRLSDGALVFEVYGESGPAAQIYVRQPGGRAAPVLTLPEINPETAYWRSTYVDTGTDRVYVLDSIPASDGATYELSGYSYDARSGEVGTFEPGIDGTLPCTFTSRTVGGRPLVACGGEEEAPPAVFWALDPVGGRAPIAYEGDYPEWVSPYEWVDVLTEFPDLGTGWYYSVRGV